MQETHALENSRRPKLHDFSDYRSFLNAMYLWSKEQDKKFSHSTFSKKAGLNSRSFLRLVISGRRNLSDVSVKKFSHAFSLSKKEEVALEILVRSNQTSNVEDKTKLWEKFRTILREDSGVIKIPDVYHFLSRWYIPVILSILRQKDVSHDIKNISKMIHVKQEQVLEGIQTLIRLGLVFEDKGPSQTNLPNVPSYSTVDHSLESQDDVPNIAIQSFHSNMLKKAIEAISLSTSAREFQALVIPMNEDAVEFVKNELRLLAMKIDDKFDGSYQGNHRVYCINLNLVPISEPFILREPNSKSQKPSEFYQKGEQL